MTTITVPAPEPTEIPRPEGDPEGSDLLAHDLYRVARGWEEYGDRARTLRSLGLWWGPASEAYRTAAATTADEHLTMAATVRRVAHATTAYAENLRAHLRDWEDLVGRKQALDRDRLALLGAIRASDATPASETALETWAADLRRGYADLVADRAAFDRRVAEDEDQLRRAFESGTTLEDALSPTGGSPLDTDALLGRPGAPGSGAGPGDVAAWWGSLSQDEREAVIAARPGLIGSADGLPAAARNEANRILLADDLATLAAKESDGSITDAERQILANARETAKALAQADGFVDPTTGERPGGGLWLYDPAAFEGDGRVAVAVGDLDTAADVSIQVPGITTEVTDVTGYVDDATRLYEAARYEGDGSSVATMFWLGYDTPDGAIDIDTVTTDRAEQGGQRLADAVDGLRASRADDPAHLTAIGHSYGSTTTSYAAADHGMAVDDVVLIGSPGAGPAETAADLGVGEEQVHVGRNSRDPVAFLGDEGWRHTPGGLGVDPSSEGFDANRFEAESAERGTIRNFADHSRYYDHDSESLYNLGRIVDGQAGDANAAAQSYDPWWRPAIDPEADRRPTVDVPGRSDTTAG